MLALVVTTWVAINGGQPAAACDFPGVVALTGDEFCTGVLVRPDLVVFAAHCGIPGEVVFGPDATKPRRRVDVDYCETNPLWDGEVGNTDIAYCTLADVPPDLPDPVPVLDGCEVDVLAVGAEVTLAGFGHTPSTGPGTKHWVTTTITDLPVAGVAFLGGADVGSCAGDSGGPMFIRLADGGYRLAGILTGRLDDGGDMNCGGTSAYVLVDRVVDVVETSSNRDITPCHRDGEWDPTPACVAPDTLMGAGTWGRCTRPSMPQATCGSSTPGAEPLTVQIVEPTAESDVLGGVPFSITAVAGGSQLRDVELRVDDAAVPDEHGEIRDEVAPFQAHGVSLSDGMHTLTAVARSWDGTTVEDTVVLSLGEPNTTGGTEMNPAASGCGCRGSAPMGGSWIVLVLLGPARRRYRARLDG